MIERIEITREEYERRKQYPMDGWKPDMECRYFLVQAGVESKPKKKRVVTRGGDDMISMVKNRRDVEGLTAKAVSVLMDIRQILGDKQMRSVDLCRALMEKTECSYGSATGRVHQFIESGHLRNEG